MPESFQRDYLLRLPLPLAQLYSRAFNAKDPRGRHDNTFYLFEALVKLGAATGAAAYLRELRADAPHVPAIDQVLTQLALPSFGQWVAILREEARFFGNRADAASHPLGHVWEQLRRPRQDLPALLDLYRKIKNGVDGREATVSACSLLEVLESLVQYRNLVFGHGGPRFESFFKHDMGPRLFPAATELLREGVFDFLGPGGSRLVYLTELRVVEDGQVEINLRDLVGLQGERMEPLSLDPPQAAGLLPNRVAVLWPGYPVPVRLDPLLQFRESELAEEVLFLNRDRDGRQVEYLSYTTGRTERDRATAPALAALLSLAAGRAVSEVELNSLAERSRAQTPASEGILSPVAPAPHLGDYEVLSVLGKGGMGVVYLARQKSLGRLVALKTLPANLVADPTALARFQREIRLLARCDNPHIVKVLASGTLPSGQLYCTMEYVPGCNLEQVTHELAAGPAGETVTRLGTSTWVQAVLSASRKQREQTQQLQTSPTEAGEPTQAPREKPAGEDGSGADGGAILKGKSAPVLPPLPELPDMPEDPGGYVRRVVLLIRDAALALQTVHDQGIVHRDVKPANLMVTPDGLRVVLMDFGLAKAQSRTGSVTRKGGFVGTLRYAAPEQLASSTLAVGPPADVRGLGVTLWELLTRRRLFSQAGDEAHLAQLILHEDVPRLRKVDPGFDRDLEAIVARATDRPVASRTQTARELAGFLQFYLDGKPLPIRPPSATEMVWRWMAAHKALVALASTAALAFLVAALTLFVSVVQGKNEAIDRAKKDALLALTRAFDAKLERGDWSVEGLRELDEIVTDLRRRDPEQGEIDSQRLVHRLKQWIQATLAGPRLGKADEKRIRSTLTWLRERDPELASSLQANLEQHRRSWAPVFDLKAPYEDLETVFETGQISLVRDHAKGLVALRPVFPTRVNQPALMPTRFRERDDLQLAATFRAPSWGQATRIGLGLCDSQGHAKPIMCLAFSPVGDFLVTAGQDGVIKVWDLAAKQLFKTLRGHRGWVNTVKFSNDGKTLASGSSDGVIKTWKTDNWVEGWATSAHLSPVMSLAFSPNDLRLYSGSSDNSVKEWDLERGRLLSTFAGSSSVQCVLILEGGKLMTTAGADGKVTFWDLGQGQRKAEIRAHQKPILGMALSPGENTLATASADGTVKLWDGIVKLWDRPSGQVSVVLLGHFLEASAVAFTPDGRSLASASYDGGVIVWDVATRREKRKFQKLKGWITGLAFAMDGKTLAAAGEDPTIMQWDAETGHEISAFRNRSYSFLIDSVSVKDCLPPRADQAQKSAAGGAAGLPAPLAAGHSQPIQCLAVSPDARWLASGGRDNCVKVWDRVRKRLEITLPVPGAWVNRVAFSPDGLWLACVGSNGGLRVWATGSWKETRSMAVTNLPAAGPANNPIHLAGAYLLQSRPLGVAACLQVSRTLPLWGLAFHPDGRSLAVGGFGQTVTHWNVADGTCGPVLIKCKRPIRDLAYSADGKMLATVEQDGTVRFYDTRTGEETEAFQAHQRVVPSLALSPDDKLLATASWDGTAAIWEVESRRKVATLRGHTTEVVAVAFGPGGKTLATAGGDGTVKVWEVSSGRELRSLESDSDSVSSVVYSPDGNVLISAGAGAIVRSWDPATGCELAGPQPREGKLTTPLSEAIRSGREVYLKILRDDTLLLEKQIQTSPVMLGQPLHMSVVLEGESLVFHVNDLAPVTYQDVFPLRGSGPGFLSVYWPDGVLLERLNCHRKPPASRPALFDQADEYYLKGSWQDALCLYQDLGHSTARADFTQEARFKEAVCLSRLERNEPAAVLLEDLILHGDSRWKLLASCRLWYLRLRQGRLPEADAVLDVLRTQYSIEQLNQAVPPEGREETLKRYLRLTHFNVKVLKPDSEENINRKLFVAELLQAPTNVLPQLRLRLADTYQLSGAPGRALQIFEELLREFDQVPNRVLTIGYFTDLLIRSKEPSRAVREVDRLLFGKAGNVEGNYYELWVFRALANSTLQKWAEAESDLDHFFTAAPREPALRELPSLIEAYRLKGFLLERKGEIARARAIWREGYRKIRHYKILTRIEPVMLASLGGEVTVDEQRHILDQYWIAEFDVIPGIKLLKNLIFSPSELAPVTRDLWNSPRGFAYARRIVFRDISLEEEMRVPVALYLFESMHHGAFPGDLSAEHDALLWQLAQDMYSAYASGRAKNEQMAQVFFIWAGTLPELNWKLLEPTLADSSLRGPMAYVFGHRCLQRKVMPAAKMFFERARDDAPTGSSLRRLAEMSLAWLQSPVFPPR